MVFSITQALILQLCGPEHYASGAAIEQSGQVAAVRQEGNNRYAAVVASGKRNYEVSIWQGADSSIQAECTCLAFYTDDHYCKHAAAAFIHLSKSMNPSRPSTRSLNGPRGKVYLSSDSDHDVVENLLGLFQEERITRGAAAGRLRDDREPLTVEFGCRLVPAGGGKYRIGIELKMGAGRLYVVQRMQELLERIRDGQSYPFTKLFAYNPLLHRFSSEDHAVLDKLTRMIEQDNHADGSASFAGAPARRTADSERLLNVPPFAWNELLNALMRASHVRVSMPSGPSGGSQEYMGVTLAREQEKAPLRFHLGLAADGEGYELSAEGLSELAVLDAYGMLFAEGIFYHVRHQQLVQLARLNAIIYSDTRDSEKMSRVTIAHEQIEPFMQRVLPGLRKLGYVQVSESIANLILYQPLQARMYLDRLRGKLLAGLEFQYGDIVLNPLEPDKPRGADRILMREQEKEHDILALMEDERFGKTEGGYLIEGDDAEFHFLHEVVPLLEQHLAVYATSAVRLRLATDVPPPKLHITWEERTDWLHFRFQMDGISEEEIRAIVRAVEEKKPYFKLSRGSLLPLNTGQFDALLRVMNGVGLHHPTLFGEGSGIPVGRAMALLDTPLEHAGIKLGRSLRELLDDMRHPDQLDFPIPEQLEPTLRDYQRYGYQWMRTLAHYRFGGILADEMGLGKTVQSIAYLLSAAPAIRASGQPALIVAPASLIYNWRNELERFAPELNAIVADGNKEERNDALYDIRAARPASSQQDHHQDSVTRPDVIITSYPLLRRDVEQYAKQPFHTVIFDEAQAFKNDTTQTAGAARAIKATYRFALTGTPIENRLDELWSIFRVVFPELFPSKKAFGELTREIVAKRSRPFLLRRLKSDVLKELPEKIETRIASELLPEQKKLYTAYLAKLRQDSLKHLDSGDYGRSRIRILAGITRLRQLCCHPALFVEGYQGSSAKFEQLMELVEECRNSGKRALIFSQFTEMLELIKRELGYRGVSFFYLDGSTPAKDRVELCNRFNDGERELFLLSLKAGGTGLNLTGADTVILYDLWWNPAVEQQAADRAHRIGQKNVVQIIRLVAEGTVEDKMVELQLRKKGLIDDIVEAGNESISSLTEQDLREILSLPDQ
ncbi:helicase SNF [Paenibacillus pinisoli]|uniref:Helicase SNF n=1 Tax=Paenibacillus pinisoli TaxID=1276110 RepID=A0A3A6PMQ3_9BACL|nr:SNF2 helicase associated domain-containing protein [Paenibacillus pinisoli]RJX39529.1 helicase SNF [Paenibacillus pinisoli]